MKANKTWTKEEALRRAREGRWEAVVVNEIELIKFDKFEMSKYLITNQQYEEFDPSHRDKRNQYSDQDDQPVIYVSWEEANKYCQWLSQKTGQNYRLPTEEEWKFAARGGGKRK